MEDKSSQTKSVVEVSPADDDGLVCRPLNTLEDISDFIRDPPAWRSLCIELKPHSEYAIKNMDIVRQNHPDESYEIQLERSEAFCHSNPDLEDVGRHLRKDLPKTLVCHDMANGYHDDSKVDGTSGYDAYTFYNWAVVDIFCYFSHHFITIPPLSWINVGHRHGVKVIGTVITEWSEGAGIWERILETTEGWQHFASALVTIAKTLKFDGWLLNVENKIAKPDALLHFVKHLHTLMHQELSSPVLIWYDSVTTDGVLSWQNGLNSKNKAFFDACDGIFTNYSWSPADVKASAELAGARLTDVFVGIDVWGRNFYGGGQFNTQQAIKVAYEHGCSLAIFAPAWTHENLGAEDMQIRSVGGFDRMRDFGKFLLRERALWGSIWPYLNTKLLKELPFQTSFCKGQGRQRRLYGEVLSPSPWYNLRHQQYQPHGAHGPHAYALATTHALRAVRRRGVLQDRSGLLHVRDSLLQREPKASLELVPVEEQDTEPRPEQQSSDDTLTSLERKRSIKEKIRDIFRKRLKKKDSEETVALDVQTVEQDSTTSAVKPQLTKVATSESSMQNVPVSLKLGGDKDKARYALVVIGEESECLEVYRRDSFIGGSCIAINPSDELNSDHRFIRLFHCDLLIEDTLVACVVTKVLAGFEEQFLNVILNVKCVDGTASSIELIGRDLPGEGMAEVTSSCTVTPLSVTDPVFKSLQKYLLLQEPGFYISVENSYGWKVRYYEAHMPGYRVSSVNCRTGLEDGPVLLGYFGLCHKRETTE